MPDSKPTPVLPCEHAIIGSCPLCETGMYTPPPSAVSREGELSDERKDAASGDCPAATGYDVNHNIPTPTPLPLTKSGCERGLQWIKGYANVPNLTIGHDLYLNLLQQSMLAIDYRERAETAESSEAQWRKDYDVLMKEWNERGNRMVAAENQRDAAQAQLAAAREARYAW